MNKIIPIIIIEFNSHNRTIQYIKDCINNIKCNNKFVFIIVDNGLKIEKYYKFNEDIIDIFSKEYVCKQNILDNFIDNRIREINSFEIGNKFNLLSIKCKKNYGFAIANNIGTIIAGNMFDFDYILFSNSDILFKKKFNLNSIIEKMNEDLEIALIGPKVVGLDNMPQTPCEQKSLWKRWNMNSIIWPINSIIRLKSIRTSDDTMYVNHSAFVYRIIGAFMVFNYKKFIEIGMFDEGTFLYAEELIIAEKLKALGYKTYYYNDEILVHEQGGSTKKSFNNFQTLKLKFKSEMYYYNKYKKVNKFTIIFSTLLFNIYILKLKIIDYIKN